MSKVNEWDIQGIAPDSAVNQNQLFDFFDQKGILSMTMVFSGGNDSGGIDDFIIETKDYSIISTNGINNSNIYTVLCKPIDEGFGTFCGEYRVDGRVFWDVENRKVHMYGQTTGEEEKSKVFEI